MLITSVGSGGKIMNDVGRRSLKIGSYWHIVATKTVDHLSKNNKDMEE